MSGTFAVNLTEARGYVANSADIDQLAMVIGCSSSGSTTAPTSFFFSGAAAQAAIGYGDGPDTLGQIIEQRQRSGNGIKRPACFMKLNDTTAGSYGVIDNTDVLGTAIPTVDSSTEPYGTHEATVTIIDDGNAGAGTAVGTTGITYQTSLSNGRPWSNTKALLSAYSIAIPNSGAGFKLEPPTAEVTAFIAAVVEARTDTLAHLADITAHDGADTSAAQVLLAASVAPITGATAWAVLDLCRAALASHEENITAHNGPDGVNVVAHAAATSVQTGIELYVEYKADFNAHLGIALGAAAAGLKAATATVAAPVTLTSSDLLDAGEALLATYARRLTFTTAGGTASDAPATATIVGTDYLGAAQSETLNLGQTATVVTTTKAWKTITTIDYPTADGTGATIAIGYGQGVHNSADVTNVLSSTTPTHGTLKTGDTWIVRTFAPAPSATDIDDAFETLVANPKQVGLLVFEFPMTAALAAHISSGLDDLAAIGIRPTALVRTRLPDFDAAETEAAWITSVGNDFDDFDDSRIVPRAGYGLLTDAMTTRQYRRSTFAQFAADVVRVERSFWPSAPAPETGGAESNVTLVDSSGATVGHDEGPRGAATGLSNDTIGNRFACEQRMGDANAPEAVYNTVPWTLAATDDRVKNLMVRRVANAMERTAISAAMTGLGGRLYYTPADPDVPSSQNTLTEVSRNALHAVVYGRLATDFASDIQNADDADVDTGLVQVSPAVTVTGGNLLGVSITLAPRVLGYLLTLDLTLAVQE